MKKYNAFQIYCYLSGAVMLGLCTFGTRLHRHYLIFIEASRNYWNGINPYALDYDSSGIFSHWLYSPSAALVYGPLTKLSLNFGNFIYMGGSLILFFWGLILFTRALRPKSQKGLGLFYLVLSSEVVGSTFGSKIEMLTIALLLMAMTLILENEKPFFSGAILALAFSFKLQPSPVVGLLFLVLLLTSRNLKIFFGFGLMLLLLFVYPFVVFPKAYAFLTYQTWLKDLNFALTTTWGEYTSFYTVSRHLFQWPKAYSEVQKVGLIFGLVFAGVVGVNALLSRERKESLILAFALGSVYMVVFSPMSQGMSYILGTPILLLSCLQLQKEGKLFSNVLWRSAILFHWWVSSLNFSDLAFPAIRIESFPVRPLGFLLLAGLYTVEKFCEMRKRVSVPRNPLPLPC